MRFAPFCLDQPSRDNVTFSGRLKAAIILRSFWITCETRHFLQILSVSGFIGSSSPAVCSADRECDP